jgi:hypothetical protein
VRANFPSAFTPYSEMTGSTVWAIARLPSKNHARLNRTTNDKPLTSSSKREARGQVIQDFRVMEQIRLHRVNDRPLLVRKLKSLRLDMDTPGDKPHDRQVLDHDSFLFRRERISCSRREYRCSWIARQFVLRAAG